MFEDDLNKLTPTLYLPTDIREVGDQAFEGVRVECVRLDHDSQNEPSALQRIGQRAFADNPMLRAVQIPASCTSIADNAFEGNLSVSICGEWDSYAQQYAYAHELPFVYLPTPEF